MILNHWYAIYSKENVSKLENFSNLFDGTLLQQPYQKYLEI